MGQNFLTKKLGNQSRTYQIHKYGNSRKSLKIKKPKAKSIQGLKQPSLVILSMRIK
jgi:hypothetical protein